MTERPANAAGTRQNAASHARPDFPLSFGPYETIDVLGEGGMGIVYRARHRRTDEVVALKTVSVARHQRLVGIRAEILALSHLHHPQIVRIRDHGVQESIPWYAMELFKGATLATHLDRIWPGRMIAARTASTSPGLPVGASGVENRLDWLGVSTTAPAFASTLSMPPAGAGHLPQILALFRAICEPLGYLHGLGIVHRDIKPSNVFIREDGVPVLMDFGLISRAEGSIGREVLEPGGQLVGTLPYLSPEQQRRESLDARADLYALGCMLYEAITGSMPVTRARSTDLRALRDINEPIIPPSDFVDGLDPRLEALVMALLAPERRARLGRADDAARILAELEQMGSASADKKPGVHVSDVPAYLYRPEIVGREDALEALSALVNGLATRRGRYVFVSGESGIGKTFLVTEVARRATILGMRLVVGECAPPDKQAGAPGIGERRGLPLQPLRPLLTMVADHCLVGGVERTDRILGEHGKILGVHVAALASLPGQDRFPDPPALSAEESHRRLLNSLLKVIAAYVEGGPPLLMVIDDLQWADELSLGALAAIESAWLEERGLMIIGTYRSDEVGKELRALTAKPGITSVAIGRMGAGAVGQIVADMLAVPTVPADVVHFLTAQTEGVPFFVAEYVRMALAEGMLQRHAGRWHFKEGQLSETELRRLPLPNSIHDLMSLRLAGINAELRTLIDLAAVIGREADIEFLAGAADASGRTLGLERVVAQVRELVRLQFLEAPMNGRYRFVHDKLREAAYAEIAPDDRIALHRSMAGMLESIPREHGEPPPYGELAHHFTQGQLWDRAVEYLEKAGEQSFSSFAHHEAIGFFTSALKHAPRVSTQIYQSRFARWERNLVDSYLGLGDMPSAHSHAARALAHCDLRFPSRRSGWFFGFLGQAALRLVRPLLPERVLRIKAGERRELVNEAAYVLNRLCEPFFLAHRPLEAFYCGFRDLNLAERVPASEALARGYATMAMGVGVGPLAKLGRTWSARAIGIARALRIDRTITYCLSRAAVVLLTVGNWKEGRERIAEADIIARRASDMRQLGETLTTLGLLEGYKGEFSRSLVAAKEVIGIGASRGDSQLQHWGRNLAVHALVRLDRKGEAAAIVHQMMEYHSNMQVGEAEKIFDLGGFALMHLTRSEMAEAQADVTRVLTAIRKQRFLPYFLKTALDATCEVMLYLLERSGDALPTERARLTADTREMVGRLRKFAALYAASRPRALIYEGQLHCQKGATKRALSIWEKALRLAQELDMAVDVGRAHVEISRQLPPGCKLAGLMAETHFNKGTELLQSAGAMWELARAMALPPLFPLASGIAPSDPDPGAPPRTSSRSETR